MIPSANNRNDGKYDDLEKSKVQIKLFLTGFDLISKCKNNNNNTDNNNGGGDDDEEKPITNIQASSCSVHTHTFVVLQSINMF